MCDAQNTGEAFEVIPSGTVTKDDAVNAAAKSGNCREK
jgi:hypothetical protein